MSDLRRLERDARRFTRTVLSALDDRGAKSLCMEFTGGRRAIVIVAVDDAVDECGPRIEAVLEARDVRMKSEGRQA